MNMIKIMKKIVLISIIIFASLLIQGNTVQAMPNLSKGKSITIGFQNRQYNSFKLTGTKWLYCIQHPAGLSSYKRNKYTVKHVVTIKYKEASANGKTVENDYNAQLAYILAKGGYSYGYGSAGSKTKRQRALWSFWNTWLSNSGTKLGISYSRYKTSAHVRRNSINKEAEEYAKQVDTNIEGTTAITCENLNSGAYKVTYQGKIDKITVTFSDNSTEEITKSSKELKFYSDKQNKNEIKDIKDIESGKAFYMYNNTPKELSKLKIHVTNRKKVYTAKLYLLRSNTGSQRLLAAKHGSSYEDLEDELEIKIKPVKGNVEIIKYGEYGIDATTKKEKLSGMKFKVYCPTVDKWIQAEDDNTKFVNFNKATLFETDEKGKIQIKNLLAGNYVYTIVEIEGNKGYYIDPIVIKNSTSTTEKDEKVGHIQVNGKTYATIENVTVPAKKKNQIVIKDNRTSGDLTIIKQDYNYNNLKLEGSEFKLQLIKGEYIENQNEWIKNQDNNSYDYTELSHDKYLTSDLAQAGTFVTDKDGKITIKGIANGTYKVYETKASKGYDITKQDGYESDDTSKQNHWVYCGEVDISTDKNNIQYNINNKKIISKLEGMVWIDRKPEVKSPTLDYIYGEQTDELLNGIPVSLYKKLRDEKGNLTGEVQKIASTKTGEGENVEDGHYRFTYKNEYNGEDKNIYYWELADCYVEFSYDNKTYIIVDPFVGNDETINSKALEYEMTTSELKDENLTGIDGQLPGKAVTYQSNQKEKWTFEQIEENKQILTAYYNNENYCVQNIHLGMFEKYTPSFSIDERIAYIKVKMKGYTYTYNYGGIGATKLDAVPTVVTQAASKRFVGSIYPSDIAYNVVKSDADDKLQVYVVYRVDIINNANSQEDNQYVEKKMYVSSLTSSYDSNRYELWNADKATQTEIEEYKNDDVKKDFLLWTEENNTRTDENGIEYKVASYKVDNNNSAFIKGIGEKNAATSYIQFKMKDEALQRILEGGMTYEDIEKAPTISEATTYHEYLRTDNVWVDNKDVKAYEGHKEKQYEDTSDAGKKYYVHKTVPNSQKTPALYLKLKLGQSRKLSGLVFEDSVSNQEYKLGNGICEDSENSRAKGVKVELLNEAKQVSDLYQVDESGKIIGWTDGETRQLPKAETYTDENGRYEFDGLVPGYYYVRFTYGDGTQKIVPANKDIKYNDYKSTIINTEDDKAGRIIQNAMEANSESTEKTEVEWYKYLNSDKYSTAVDDISQRLNENSEYDKNEPITLKNVNAYTPRTSISIENDVNDYTDDTENQHKSLYGGFNFGIISVPEKVVKLNKIITDVDILTQNGMQIISGNPESNVKYLSDLDGLNNNGSTYAKAEIDPDSIYSSSLKTTYKITISNESDRDYIERQNDEHYGYYYKYGDLSNAEAKKITVTEVKDYLDKDYDLDTTQQILSSNTASNITLTPVETETAETEANSPDNENAETTDNTKIYTITGWGGLATSESESIEYSTTTLLKLEDNDTSYINTAEITKLSLEELTTLESDYNWEDGYEEAVITITPTTGEDRRNINWIIAAIILIGMSTGVVILIKKSHK